jgi:hypothetical protein
MRNRDLNQQPEREACSVQRIFALQLVVFIVAGFLFSWTPLRLALHCVNSISGHGAQSVAHSSSEYAYVPILWASVLALFCFADRSRPGPTRRSEL